jgi:NTP pyrophosphatase (non-canonical NTP hydrolase)
MKDGALQMVQLKQNPNLRDIQDYVSDMERERGFAEQGPVHKCLMLGEEIGELFKAVRKAERLGIDENSAVGSIREELADILIYVCAIANRYGVDLELAFREKETANHSRVWK